MKKTTLLLSFLVVAVSLSAQRISSLTIDGLTSCVPFAAFNPKNNLDTQPGDGQIIFLDGTDFSNVNVSLRVGTDSFIESPDPLPTDWSSTIAGLKVTKTDLSSWAKYDITLKTIKPGTLPLEILTGAGNFNSDSWTTETIGWAGVCIDKSQNVIRFGSANRSFLVAFDSAPDSIYFTMKALGTWDGSDNIFDVDGSIDGVSWTSIKQYNSTNIMPPSSTAVIENIKLNNTAYRYIRWIYSTRNTGVGAFNVSLENIKVTRDIGTNVSSASDKGVRLYPSGSQTLHIENADEVKSLRVYNISGALLMETMNPSAVVPMNGFVAGVYLGEMRLKSGSVVTIKFVK